MKLLTAYVNGSPRQVTTKYGERTVMDVRLASGETTTIWGAAGSLDILGREGGERVQIAIDSKGKYHVVEHCGTGTTTAGFDVSNVTTATLPQTVTSKELAQPTYNAHNGRSAEIADYIERLGKLYNHCYRTAKSQVIDESMASEDYRTIATTLFIQTTKHFNL